MQKVFICVTGNIGCGKSTVAGLIANIFGLKQFEESVDDNPYLKPFYDDMPKWSYLLQRYFLLSRVIAHEKMIMAPYSCVQDRSVYEDVEIFAKTHAKKWTPGEIAHYQTLCRILVGQLKPPDLVIYLNASLPVLRERIRKRARSYESALTSEDDPYLAEIQELYRHWIRNFTLTKKLIVNTDNMNLVKNPDDISALVDAIRSALERNVPLTTFGR